MAVEAKRGCGYRKVGGTYMIGGSAGVPCCKLPIALHVCPTCGGGIKQARGWTWIDPRPWLKGECTKSFFYPCGAATPEELGDKVGLLWIGTQFYKTPADFLEEANKFGICRRIPAIPQGFELGKHWVFLAHPHVFLSQPRVIPEPKQQWEPGIFRIFKPTRIEKVVTQTQSEDADEMAKLEKRGITPFIVPDDDKDHQGSVYDKEEEDAEQIVMELAL